MADIVTPIDPKTALTPTPENTVDAVFGDKLALSPDKTGDALRTKAADLPKVTDPVSDRMVAKVAGATVDFTLGDQELKQNVEADQITGALESAPKARSFFASKDPTYLASAKSDLSKIIDAEKLIDKLGPVAKETDPAGRSYLRRTVADPFKRGVNTLEIGVEMIHGYQRIAKDLAHLSLAKQAFLDINRYQDQAIGRQYYEREIAKLRQLSPRFNNYFWGARGSDIKNLDRVISERTAALRKSAAALVQLLQEQAAIGPLTKETQSLVDQINKGKLNEAAATVFSEAHVIMPELFFQSLPVMTPAVLAGLATGGAGAGPALALTMSSAIMGMSSYMAEFGGAGLQALKDEGVDVTKPEELLKAAQNKDLMARVRRKAHLKGAIVGALDAVSVGVATIPMRFGLKGATGNLVNLTAQGLAQGALGAGGEIGGQLAIGGEINWGEAFLEFLGEFTTTPIEIAAYGPKGLIKRVGAARAQKRIEAYRDLQNQSRAVQFKNQMDLVHEKLADMDTRTKDPQAYDELLQSIIGDRTGDDVVIPADAWKAGIEQLSDEEKVALQERLGLTQQLENSAADADLSIPLDGFLREIVGNDTLYQALADFMKADDSTPSVSEVTAMNSQAVQELQERIAQITQTLNEDEARLANPKSIGEKVAAALIEQGFTKENAVASAAVHEAFAEALENRFGVDSAAVYRRMGLEIQGPATPTPTRIMVDPQIDRLKVANTLAEMRRRANPVDLGEMKFPGEPMSIEEMLGEVGKVELTPATLGEILQAAGRGMEDLADLLVASGLFPEAPTAEQMVELISALQEGRDVSSVEGVTDEDIQALTDEMAAMGLDPEQLGDDQIIEALAAPREVTAEEPAPAEIEELDQGPSEIIGMSPELDAEDALWIDWEPEKTAAGKLRGVPERVKNIAGWRKEMERIRQWTAEGEAGRFWYENSAKAIWRLVGGDIVEAEKLIQLIAIYSPNTPVFQNFGAAVRVYNQWKAGEELHAATEQRDTAARQMLLEGVSWEGRKTNNFYMNLMHYIVHHASDEQVAKLHLDAEVMAELAKPVTVDVWITRAFAYANDQTKGGKKDAGGNRFSVMERALRRITAELNAELKPGERRWMPHQVQAALWVATKMRYETPAVKADANAKRERAKTPLTREKHLANWRKGAEAVDPWAVQEQLAAAMVDYATSADRMTQTITWEAIPSSSLGLEITGADRRTKAAFLREARQIILGEEGEDLIAEAIGVPLNRSELSTGFYDGAINDNVVTSLLPTKPAGRFDRTQANLYARAIQYVFRQDAVPFFRADAQAKFDKEFKVINTENNRTLKKFDTQEEAEAFAATKPNTRIEGGPFARGRVLTFQGPLSAQSELAFSEALTKYMGGDAGYTKVASNEIVVINFRGDDNLPFMGDETFLEVMNALEQSDEARGLGLVGTTSFGSEGEYGHVQDWAADPEGGEVRALLEAGPPALLDQLDGWRAAFDRLVDDYSGDNLAARQEELLQVEELHQSVWHGSPKFFEKFSIDFLGTGEGAQAFGWGLYFAQKRGVAEWYRDKLTKAQVERGYLVGGVFYPKYEALSKYTKITSPQNLINQAQMGSDKPFEIVINALEGWAGTAKEIMGVVETAIKDRNEALNELNATWADTPDSTIFLSERRKVAHQIVNLSTVFEEAKRWREVGWERSERGGDPGKLYQVAIPEDDYFMLWDAPFEAQPPRVQEAFRALLEKYDVEYFDPAELRGRKIYYDLARAAVNDPFNAVTPSGVGQREISLALAELGVVGHKFEDGSSRGREADHTYNYVVYDDDHITIEEVYQDVWHGSPHPPFRYFADNKIGTGEGAQAFGYGHYLAGARAVAEYYRNYLDAAGKGIPVVTVHSGDQVAHRVINGAVKVHNGDLQTLAQDIQAKLADAVPGRGIMVGGFIYPRTDVETALAALQTPGNVSIEYSQGGTLYRTSIPEDSEFINWDEPWSEQPRGVKDRLRNMRRNIPLAKRARAQALRAAEELNLGGNSEQMLLSDIDFASTIGEIEDAFARIGEDFKIDILNLEDLQGISIYYDLGRALKEARADGNVLPGIEGNLFQTQKDNDKAASAWLQEHSIPGHRYLDQESRVPPELLEKMGGVITHNYVIYTGETIQIEETLVDGNMPWTPPVDDLNQAARGSTRFEEYGDGTRRTLISLFQAQNLSTFLHESGHFFHRVLEILATDGNQAAQAEIASYNDWFERSAADLARQGKVTEADVKAYLKGDLERGPAWDAIRVATQEYFARGFEAYLYEGRAPTRELRNVFRRFADWLISIYRDITALDVRLDDDVRVLMDRLLASDVAMQNAGVDDIIPVFEQNDLGIDATAWKAYQETQREASLAARERTVQKATERARRQRSKQYNTTKKLLRITAEDEVAKQPEALMGNFLRNGILPDGTEVEPEKRVKLNYDQVVQEFGPAMAERLRRKGYARKSGELVAPEDAALMFGFTEVTDALNRLAYMVPLKEQVDERVTAALDERFGDGWDTNDIAQDVQDALHGGERMLLIEQEMKALAVKTGQAPTPSQAARAAAEAHIAALPVNQAVKVQTWLNAERKAARAAQAAMAQGDAETAQEQVRKRFMAYHLYVASRAARDEVASMRAFVRRYNSAAAKKSINYEYSDQIDAILEGYTFKQSTLKSAEKRQALMDLVAKIEAEGLMHNIPDEVIQALGTERDYRLIPMQELRGVLASVRNLEQLGRLKNKLLINHRQRVFDDAKFDIIEELKDNNPKLLNRDRTWKGDNVQPQAENTFRALLKEGAALLRKPESLISQAAGVEGLSHLHQYLFTPLSAAQSAETKMRQEAVDRFASILDRHYTKSERGKAFSHKEEITVTDVSGKEKSFGHHERIGYALHMGNEYNREAVQEGWGFSKQTEDVILEGLTDADWSFVQDVWDWINEYWEPSRQLNREMTGSAPEKVEATPFVTPQGRVMRGGYFPLKFSHEGTAGIRAEARELYEQSKDDVGFQNRGGAKAQTRQGHLKERKNTGGQLPRLDGMAVTAQHVSEVIHDLTHRKAIADAYKFLGDTEMKEALAATMGATSYKYLLKWVGTIAGENPDAHMNLYNRTLKRLRKNTSIVAMGFKMTTALVQPLGIVNAVEFIGYRATLAGIMRTWTNPVAWRKKWNWIIEQSGEMADRTQTFNRDIRDALTTLTPGSVGWMQRNAFVLTAMADRVVVFAVWDGAYNQGINQKGYSHAEAVEWADSVVRQSQGAGSPKDLAAIQSSWGETGKAFTMFYSFFSALYNATARRIGISVKRGEYLKLFHHFMLLYFVQSALEYTLRHGIPDDDDDDKNSEWWLGLAAAPFKFALGTVPVVRDAVDQTFGYQASPAFGSLGAVGKAATTLFGDLPAAIAGFDDFTENDLRTVIDGLGAGFGLPTRQAYITLRYMIAFLNGDTEETDITPQMIYQAIVSGLDREERRKLPKLIEN